ncbi:MAG: acyl-CoA dehydrogenase family protein, partial [Rhodococcus sp. (in: high G+C Gram-positive bacteria)]
MEVPRRFRPILMQARSVAEEVFRPISRKYDLAEHAYPVELDTLANLFEGLQEAKTISFAGADAFGGRNDEGKKTNVNGANMSALLNALEVSWGDVALLLSIPFQGLGNAAISSVANKEQLERFGKVWASMAITEPSFGSDSAAVSTTATLDGDEYVINGEKIFVTAGSRATHIVVWATVDKS